MTQGRAHLGHASPSDSCRGALVGPSHSGPWCGFLRLFEHAGYWLGSEENQVCARKTYLKGFVDINDWNRVGPLISAYKLARFSRGNLMQKSHSEISGRG